METTNNQIHEVIALILSEQSEPSALISILGETAEEIEEATKITLERPTNEEVNSNGMEKLLSFLICRSVDMEGECKEYIQSLALAGPKKVCQLSFKRNDIVWICKTCQMDETCVLCNVCWRDSNHDGHEVYFYHAQAGGCCDCGDADAWSPDGFCSVHGKVDPDPTRHLDKTLVSNTRIVFATVVSTLLRSLQDCHCSMDVLRHVSYRYARWKTDREAGTGPRDESTHLRRVQALTEMLAAGESGDLVLHWNELVTRVDMVAALVALTSHVDMFSQVQAETLATQCQKEGSVVVGSFSCDTWQAVLAGTQSEESEVLLDQHGEAAALLAGLDLLTARDLIVSVHPKSLKVRLERVGMAMCWLETMAGSCDGIKRLICESLDRAKLAGLMLVDALAPRKLANSMHALYLELMADEFFKVEMSRSYVTVYRGMGHRYVRGLGSTDNSLYTLSVQFLNREKFVSMLSEEHSLLSVLARSITDALTAAAKPRPTLSARLRLHSWAQRRLDKLRQGEEVDEEVGDEVDDGTADEDLEAAADDLSNCSPLTVLPELHRPLHCGHPVLLHRRYSPAISDLKCVLNVPGVARQFCVDPPHDAESESMDGEDRRLRRRRQRDCLKLFCSALALIQGMDPLTRRAAGPHVEFESRDWMNSFNVNISLCSAFDHLLGWLRTAPPECSNSVADMLQRIADAVFDWNLNFLGEPTLCVKDVISNGSVTQTTIWASEMLANASFHAPLLRFFSHSITESSRSPSLCPVLSNLVTGLASNASALGLVELPLSILVMAAQARVGMWRRNGQSMSDQLMNYSEPPFCRLFRDPDIYMLQFGALCYPGNDKVGLFVNHVMHRFGCWDLFMKEEVREEGEFTLTQTVLLAEDMLHLLIVFTTELPIPPQGECEIQHSYAGQDKDERMLMSIRREMVHQLAHAPCTYSEALESVAMVTRSDNAGPDLLEAMLTDIADRRPGVGLEPVKYVLKPACWSEYDPCFFHLSAPSHQSAAERRPSASGPSHSRCSELESEAAALLTACESSPSDTKSRAEYHKVLAELSCRGSEGKEPVAAPVVGPPAPPHPIYAELRSGVLTDAAMLRFIRRVIASALTPATPDTCSSILLIRSLHLLTLAVHTTALLPPSHAHRVQLFSSLVAPIGFGSEVSLVKSLQSLLTTSWGSEACVSSGARWVVNMAAALDQDVASLVTVRQAPEASVSSSESRRAAARAKALASISSQANAFMAAMDDETDEEEEEAEEQTDSRLECIICREASESPLGYLGFAQLSRACPSAGRHRERRCGISITCCGHALHEACYATYFATTVQKAEHSMSMAVLHGGLGHTALDLSAGELQCPLCKRVANLLIPACEGAQDSVSEERACDTAYESESVMSWLRALVEEKLTISEEVQEESTPSIVSSFVRSVFELSQSPHLSSHTDLESYRGNIDSCGLKELTAGCWAFAYSVSSYIAERDYKAKQTVEMAEENGYERSIDYLTAIGRALKSFVESRTMSDLLTDCLREALTDSGRSTPLLCRNMLETLTAVLLLPQTGEPTSAVFSMSLARLVQLVWAELACLDLEGGEIMNSEETAMMELARLIQTEVGGSCSSAGEGGGGNSTNAEKVRQGLINVEKGMCAFGAAASLAVELITGGRVHGMPAAVDLTTPELDDTVRAWVRRALAGVMPFMSSDSIVKRMDSDYPWGEPVKLAYLPDAYTELHLDLTTRMGKSEKELRPALCLLCGDVLDADGKGNCTAHVKHCGLGVGMFFLLQDCTVVLMHGPRASYLSSPYVDDHGERHGQYRGRPLYLSAARVELLRSLVANHKIPSSVVLSRSTSHKVIISGYY